MDLSINTDYIRTCRKCLKDTKYATSCQSNIYLEKITEFKFSHISYKISMNELSIDIDFIRACRK